MHICPVKAGSGAILTITLLTNPEPEVQFACNVELPAGETGPLLSIIPTQPSPKNKLRRLT